MAFLTTLRRLLMQHPNKRISDNRKLRQLYESGAVFTAFDTETTSITPSTGRIMEIGAVKFTKDGIISTWQHLFNPNQILTPFIIDLTHITQEMVDCEDTIDCHLCSFLDFIKDTILIAHNAQFDLNFLNAECSICGTHVTHNKFVDTLYLSKIVLPEPEKHKLDYLADYYKINKGSSHRAQDDANTCKELFELCISKIQQKNQNIN